MKAAMKKKVDFQKLIDGEYDLSTELQVLNWMLKTGQKFEEHIGRWDVAGVDRTIFGYSGDSHESYTNLGIDFDRTLFIGFCNAIVKTPDKPTKRWKEAERIYLGQYRMLEMLIEAPEDKHTHDNRQWNLYWAIKGLFEYNNHNLKKEYFQPQYPDRTYPKIIDMKLTTIGNGYMVEYIYSFKNSNYEPGWSRYITQNNNESIDMFINRAHKEIKQVLE